MQKERGSDVCIKVRGVVAAEEPVFLHPNPALALYHCRPVSRAFVGYPRRNAPKTRFMLEKCQL